VRVAEVGSDHVSLVWQSPDGDVILYEVSYGTDNFYRNISLAYSIQSNITLRQLRQHTVYVFRVRQKRIAMLAFLPLIASGAGSKLGLVWRVSPSCSLSTLPLPPFFLPSPSLPPSFSLPSSLYTPSPLPFPAPLPFP